MKKAAPITNISLLEGTKLAFARIIDSEKWHNMTFTVTAKTLTAEEAIGNPERRDFPIVEGKETVIEATIMEAKAHVFTDTPVTYSGGLDDILNRSLDNNGSRALYVGALNAALKYLGIISTTLHCRDEEPEQCARDLASYIQTTYGTITTGLIGLNPAIADGLIAHFGPDRVRITDLNLQNVGKSRNGVTIWDGRDRTDDLVRESDLVVLTGTTIVNGTFDLIWSLIKHYSKKHLIFGVTAGGFCHLEGFARFCPYGRR